MTCSPRFTTKRSPERVTLGAELVAAMASFGMDAMDRQRDFFDGASELIPGTRIPAFREIVGLAPRQNAKTITALAFVIHRALLWGSPQTIAWTAQDGHAAAQKVLDDVVPLLTARGSVPLLPSRRSAGGVAMSASTSTLGPA